MIRLTKEDKIAKKISIDLKYPKWDKDREFWKCSCGKQMIQLPFKRWKEDVVNRMYRLRLREVNKKAEEIFDEIEDWLSAEGEEDWRAWDSDYLDKYDQLKAKHLNTPSPKQTNEVKK